MTDEQNSVTSPPLEASPSEMRPPEQSEASPSKPTASTSNPTSSGTSDTKSSNTELAKSALSKSNPLDSMSDSDSENPVSNPVSNLVPESSDATSDFSSHTDIQTPLLTVEKREQTEGQTEKSLAADPPVVGKPRTEPGNAAVVKEESPKEESPEKEASKEKTLQEGTLEEEPQKEEPRRPSSGLFKKYITENKIFKNREVLRHSYSPRELPHRDEQIDSIAEILAPALQGATPSNILIYGKTGTGKTATVKYVGGELENESSGFTPCRLIHLNCETIDTQYRVLAQIANCVSEIDSKASDRVKNTIPPTGWHTDQVYSELKNILEHAGGLQIIVLDEIDKLVKKSGDDTLYSLTRINSDLTKSRVCIIGISNDLTFKDFLDPRVLSSLSEEELVFPPYNAAQLADILKQRAQTAFLEGAVSDDVISLCAARAAQEHGDARRALDLLRVSGELAEREGASHVEERHVAAAQESIETDTMSECVKTLPVQSKIVLSSMLLLAGSGQKVFTSGQVVGIYRDLVKELDADSLSHRRVSELINDLTMLGIVSSRVVSYGRHGRTTEIYFDKPTNEIRRVIMNEPRFMECSILSSLIR